MKRKLLLGMLVGTLMLPIAACDSPAENAAEERLEDVGEAAGMSEEAAEDRAEAMTDSAGTAAVYTDTSGTVITTTTTVTTTTTTTP